MRNILLGAVLLLSACGTAGAPVYAQPVCEVTWETAQAMAADRGLTVRQLPEGRLEGVGAWYNAIPPETDFVFNRIVFLTGPGLSILVFFVEDCAVGYQSITPNQLEVAVPQA